MSHMANAKLHIHFAKNGKLYVHNADFVIFFMIVEYIQIMCIVCFMLHAIHTVCTLYKNIDLFDQNFCFV